MSENLERASLDADYRRRKLEIRETPGLSWEQKERQIKVLGDEHYVKERCLETNGETDRGEGSVVNG